jgi:hypothetical protein
MIRKWALALAIVVVASACANPIGRSVPECESVGTSMVLQVQSVPGSSFVSCVNALKAGWSFEHLEARNGHSVFRLDSDRWGDSFLEVESVLSCDVGAAAGSDVEDLPVRLFKDVVSETTVDIVVVPEGTSETTRVYSAEIRSQLESISAKGRTAEVSVSISNAPTAARVSAAAASGAHVITISIRDVEEGTLSLILSGQDIEYEGDLDQVIDEIEDAETESSYRGKWYYVFEGGCVVYTFDAVGPGVDTIERDVELALGLFDAQALRQSARDAGYDLP